MSIKLLADENVSRELVTLLRSRGYDVLWIREYKRGIDDIAVIELAQEKERILITGDKDFGYLVFRQYKRCHGLVLLRVDEHEKRSLFVDCFDKYQDKLKGCFTVITDKKIRFQPMEILK
jgi:predicted nuclease of predicted toxin-antitoxin system